MQICLPWWKFDLQWKCSLHCMRCKYWQIICIIYKAKTMILRWYQFNTFNFLRLRMGEPQSDVFIRAWTLKSSLGFWGGFPTLQSILVNRFLCFIDNTILNFIEIQIWCMQFYDKHLQIIKCHGAQCTCDCILACFPS